MNARVRALLEFDAKLSALDVHGQRITISLERREFARWAEDVGAVRSGILSDIVVRSISNTFVIKEAT